MYKQVKHNFNNVLITGASSGIGKALAEKLSQTGTKILFLCGRDSARLSEVSEKCRNMGVEVHSSIIDVKNKDTLVNWINECNSIAAIDLVFANAGVATGQNEDSESVRNTFDINVTGVVNTVLPAIEIFQKRSDSGKSKGHIAITASVAGYHGMPSCPSYSATKACVKAWGEGLRGMLAHENIRISVICPGFIRSRITDKNTCPMPFFMEADKAACIILHRLSKNAGLIAFPWQMRFAVWILSILPNRLSDAIYPKIPGKV